ncbi:MAG: winged helix-turn-helix transcriptional regulator [Nitratireductor sp.]|nr:winged helix-turn-helix transcriptional regulator [Nitratireductor sp.]
MGETLSGAHARESIAGDSAAVSSQMLENAKVTTAFLKSLSHPVRLVILCRLAEGKTSVGELEALVGVPQAAVSKQLARLRDEGLVDFERAGRSILYSLSDARTHRIIKVLYEEFCE